MEDAKVIRLAPLSSSIALIAACGASPAVDPPDPTNRAIREPVLRLDFDDRASSAGTLLAVANTGSGAMSTSVVVSDEGTIIRGEGFSEGAALRFPAYTATSPTPAAVLLVHATDPDELDPGVEDFEFGADFDLDEISSGSETDNGDNLVQRGLFEDPAQYKLQLDHGVASCRIAGEEGGAVVKAPRPVARETWYRIVCRRSGDQVTLILRALSHSATEHEMVTTVSARTGRVRLPMEVPMTVGGKVSAAGKITTSSTDQFNGLVDNVIFQVLG